jgi:DNA replication and repair protein RecF
MKINHLSLTNFRNFARLDIDVPDGPVLLYGANGEGKTSILEAIYFLATFTSFQAKHDREMVNLLAGREPLAVGRMVAQFERSGDNHRLEVRLIKETNGINGSSRLRKEILLDGLKLKVSEVIGKFTAVLFLPQMVEVIEGSPENRRRFLNLAMSQTVPGFSQTFRDYSQTLVQRNALLKQLQELGGDPNQLEYWDELLVSKGAELIFQRIQVILELGRIAARNHSELTRGDSVLRLAYQPSYDPLPEVPGQFTLPIEDPLDRSSISIDEIRKGFGEHLLAQREAEIGRGTTIVGPHRDELRFLENGIDLGTYGSRGQVRTAMLSLIIAEMTWMEAKTGHSPVFLLDEALAELDPTRRADLLDYLTSNSQTLVTTTDLDLFSRQFTELATLWEVSGGRVLQKESKVEK